MFNSGLFQNKKGGFSIIEVMVALAVIATISVAVLTLLASAFRANLLLKNTIVASGLAEEGLELIRAVRDGNWLESKTADGVNCFSGTTQWREGLCAGTYVIDYDDDLSSEFETLYATGNDFLCRDNNGYFIGRFDNNSCPSGSSVTQFRRQIVISNSSVSEFIANVYIYWCRNGIQPCLANQENALRIEQRFYNWLGS